MDLLSTSYQDHEITQFGEAVSKYKDNIQEMLEACKGKINKFDEQLETLNKCEDVIKVISRSFFQISFVFLSVKQFGAGRQKAILS